MRAFGLLVFCLVVGLGVGAAWCGMPSQIYSYRYRMTVEVTADSSERSASSVIEVQLDNRGFRLPESRAVKTTVLGDAIFIDLGRGRNLVALLASGPNAVDADFPEQVIPGHFHHSYSSEDLARLAGLRDRWDLPASQMPTFVTFGDQNDPTTVRVVAPASFQAVFGPDVRFKRITIEMTAAPVTRHIETVLVWLRRMKAEGFGSRIQTRPGKFTVNVPYFTRARSP